MKYYYGKNKKVFLVSSWLIFVVMFFSALSFINYPSSIKYAYTYHPFHMAYGDIKDGLKPLDDNEVASIVHKNNNSITRSNTVKFLRNRVFTVFSVNDVNRTLKTNYRVKPNLFIYVHPYDINDGYKREDINIRIPSIDINSDDGVRKFKVQDTIIKPLFGQINCISNNIILVNEDDYNWIALNGTDYVFKGTLHLYNFASWRNSNPIVNEVRKRLLKGNNRSKEDAFYKISSKVEAYNTSLKSCNFLIFNLIYICVLLYFSVFIMIHYKLMMEYKDDQMRYFSLYKIGIDEIEIKRIVKQKILMTYFIPFIYAVIINIPFSYYVFNSHIHSGLENPIIITTSIAFFIIHLVMCKLYTNVYYKRIISELP